MKNIIGALLLSALIPTAVAEDENTVDAYLCIPDMATGFKFTDGKWKQSNFDTDDIKYIFRRSKESDFLSTAYPWVWSKLGEERPAGYCEETFSSIGVMNCSGIGGDMQISSKTLRFQETNSYGYVFDGFKDGNIPDGSSTPFIMIGKCSAL